MKDAHPAKLDGARSLRVLLLVDREADGEEGAAQERAAHQTANALGAAESGLLPRILQLVVPLPDKVRRDREDQDLEDAESEAGLRLLLAVGDQALPRDHGRRGATLSRNLGRRRGDAGGLVGEDRASREGRRKRSPELLAAEARAEVGASTDRRCHSNRDKQSQHASRHCCSLGWRPPTATGTEGINGGALL